MFEFFDMISDVVGMFVNYVVNFITTLINMVEMLLAIPAVYSNLLTYLPGVIGAFAAAFIAIRVVFMLVGR